MNTKGQPFKTVLTAQRQGKTAMMNEMIDKALDAGETIYIASKQPGMSGYRGVATTKDVTPVIKRIEKK